MSKPGRPPVITDDIASIIAKMKDRHHNWSVRDIEQKFDSFAKAENKRHLIGKGPGRTAINEYIRTKLNPNTAKMGLEKTWSSAELNNEKIDSESVRWLITLQVYRKSYYSKLLTVREAKWFSYLSGFRKPFEIADLTEFGISLELKDVFISSVIVTWAEIYAYREKIDTMAGIENSDYSDLDSNIANGDFKAIYQYNENYLYDAMGKIANREDVVKKDLEVFDNQYLLPSLIDQIRFQEIEILVHSLGEPDMSHKSIRLYTTILAWISLDNPQFFKDLMKLPYVKRRNLLTSIREWVKDNPSVNDDNIIALKVNELFDSVREKGKNKTKFKKGYRITIDDLQKMKENYEKEGGANG
jgi:hypothetical protein